MALANYSDLTTAIASWTHRGDLSSIAADLVTLAEQRIYNGSEQGGVIVQPLRLRLMEQQETGNASNGVISIPTGYIETIRLKIVSGGEHRNLTYRSPQAQTQYEGDTGVANFYTRINQGLKVAPATAAYVHDYYKKFDALTSTNTTNTLMTNYPNIYLFACLVEAFQYINNPAKAGWAFQMLADAVNSAQKSDRRSAYGHGLAVVVA